LDAALRRACACSKAVMAARRSSSSLRMRATNAFRSGCGMPRRASPPSKAGRFSRIHLMSYMTYPTVMAGLVPAIHVLSRGSVQRRGCPA